MPSGTVISAVAVEDFLFAAETTKATEEFEAALKTKYDIKTVGSAKK